MSRPAEPVPTGPCTVVSPPPETVPVPATVGARPPMPDGAGAFVTPPPVVPVGTIGTTGVVTGLGPPEPLVPVDAGSTRAEEPGVGRLESPEPSTLVTTTEYV